LSAFLFLVDIVSYTKKIKKYMSLNPFYMMMMSLLFCQCTVYPFMSRFYYDLFCLHSGAPLQRTHFYMLLKTLYLMNVIAVMISTLSF